MAVPRILTLSLRPISKFLLVLVLAVFLSCLITNAKLTPDDIFAPPNTIGITTSFDLDEKPDLTGHVTHPYVPAGLTDSRSPCPALNTLANHGYLPRDGKHITPTQMVHALKAGYHLSTPLARFLTYGGYFLLRAPPPPSHLTKSFWSPHHVLHGLKSLPSIWKVVQPLDLAELALHNHIEHNASLAHSNTLPPSRYAPTGINHTLLTEFLNTSTSTVSQHITLKSIAHVRTHRELSSPIDPFHAEIARGEMALVLGIFGSAPSDVQNINDGEGVDVDILGRWFGEERLPEGWTPKHVQTLPGTMKISGRMREWMKKLQAGLGADNVDVDDIEVAVDVVKVDLTESSTSLRNVTIPTHTHAPSVPSPSDTRIDQCVVEKMPTLTLTHHTI